jgi:hypothetical protein
VYVLWSANENDIVLTVLAATTFPIIGIILLLSISYLWILRRVSFQVNSIYSLTNDNDLTQFPLPVTANTRTYLIIGISGLKYIAPFLRFSGTPYFSQYLRKHLPLKIESFTVKQDYTILELGLTFPHRGIFSLEGVEISIQDIFGLSYVTRRKALRNGAFKFKVNPTIFSPQRLPLIATNITEGDTSFEELKSSGDYYEFKKYERGDGVRRIVWKIFARSGELISRHPEKSSAPDGTVYVLALLQTEDDYLATLLNQYLNLLNESDLEVRLLTHNLGAPKNAFISPNFEVSEDNVRDNFFSSNLKIIRKALGDVFIPTEKSILVKDLLTVAVQQNSSPLRRLVILGNQSIEDYLITLGETCLSLQITPQFLVASDLSKVPKLLELTKINNWDIESV